MDFTDNIWIDFILSIGILAGMINHRESITPDVLHFISSMVDDEVHFICIMAYWLLWKCFLTLDEIKNLTKAQIVEERIKIVVRALIELVLALILAQGSFESFWPWVYCLSVFAMTAMRSIYSEFIDLTATIFVVMYIM